MNKRRDRAWMTLAAAMLLVTGCVSNRREGVLPKFRHAPAEPVAIRVDDRRPPLEQRIEAGRGEWLYFRQNPSEQSAALGAGIGNALNIFGATRGYRIVTLDSPARQWPVLIHLELREGMARWPVAVGPEDRNVPVQGLAEVRYTVYRRGRRLDRGVIRHEPPDLQVPITAIRRDNVEKMVTESLAHQYGLAMRKVMDELLHDLADVWPELTEKK